MDSFKKRKIIDSNKYITIEDYLNDPTYIDNTKWINNHAVIIAGLYNSEENKIQEIYKFIDNYHSNYGFAIKNIDSVHNKNLKLLFKFADIKIIAKFANAFDIATKNEPVDAFNEEFAKKNLWDYNASSVSSLAYRALYARDEIDRQNALDYFNYWQKNYE